MTASERQTSSRIPTFASREEEAAWWDTHDLADYQDELKTVDMQFAPGALFDRIELPLDPAAIVALRARAEEEGIDPTALALTWVLERLGLLTEDMRATPHRHA